jgi:hypothetical protein
MLITAWKNDDYEHPIFSKKIRSSSSSHSTPLSSSLSFASSTSSSLSVLASSSSSAPASVVASASASVPASASNFPSSFPFHFEVCVSFLDLICFVFGIC